MSSRPSAPQRQSWLAAELDAEFVRRDGPRARRRPARLRCRSPCTRRRLRSCSTALLRAELEGVHHGAGGVAHAGGDVGRARGAPGHEQPVRGLFPGQEAVLVGLEAPVHVDAARVRRDDAGGQDDQVDGSGSRLVPESTSSASTTRRAGPSSGVDAGHLALDQVELLVLLARLVEVLQAARGADVDVEDVDLGFGVLLPDVARLLERSQAADARAVLQVVLVAGAGALHEGHRASGARRPTAGGSARPSARRAPPGAPS